MISIFHLLQYPSESQNHCLQHVLYMQDRYLNFVLKKNITIKYKKFISYIIALHCNLYILQDNTQIIKDIETITVYQHLGFYLGNTVITYYYINAIFITYKTFISKMYLLECCGHPDVLKTAYLFFFWRICVKTPQKKSQVFP